jgi:hypothetical protein
MIARRAAPVLGRILAERQIFAYQGRGKIVVGKVLTAQVTACRIGGFPGRLNEVGMRCVASEVRSSARTLPRLRRSWHWR